MKPLYLAILVLVLLSGCDRPFADVGMATIEVVSPDVTVATDRERVLLDLRVTSVRTVTQVRASGVDFSSIGDDIWRAELDLVPGINRFAIESMVDDGPVSRDTVDVLRVRWARIASPTDRPLLFGIGGHTMSRLQNGTLVMVGGSALAGSQGSFDAWILPPNESRFAPARTQAAVPRVGHTATVLPDNRILLTGGGYRGNIETTDELVETVELFNPESETFTAVPVDGAPIRRMYHTALLRNLEDQVYLVLLGGRGDTRYTPSPQLGIRRDMRTFLFRNDSLIALSPAIGPFIRPVAGHTQVALDGNEEGMNGRFLVTGMDLENDYQGVNFLMDFDAPAGIDIREWSPLRTPRIRHTSVAISPGYVVHLGGRDPETDQPLGGGEIHVESVRSSFYLPPGLASAITTSYGGTATHTSEATVITVGGFDSAGEGLSDVNFVSLSVQ